jgi:hypothetical protein
MCVNACEFVCMFLLSASYFNFVNGMTYDVMKELCSCILTYLAEHVKYCLISYHQDHIYHSNVTRYKVYNSFGGQISVGHIYLADAR